MFEVFQRFFLALHLQQKDALGTSLSLTDIIGANILKQKYVFSCS